MKKTVLVFGASGFIATYLIQDLILNGYNVVASDIDDDNLGYYSSLGVDFHNIDITNVDQFRRLQNKKFDAVINLAASQPANISKLDYDPTNFINVNVIGTLNILKYCQQSNSERFIHAISHRNTQGLWQKGKKITEDDRRAIKYDGEYAMFSISESTAHDCILHYQSQFSLPVVIFRLPPVYGYGPHTRIYKNGEPIKTGFEMFIEKAKSGEAIELWGDPDVGRDIIYIRDVVSAYLIVLNSLNVQGLYNITSCYPLSLREQARIIIEKFWKSAEPPTFIERPELTNSIEPFLYDNSKAFRDFEWEPKFDFAGMIDDYIITELSGKFKFLNKKRDVSHSQMKDKRYDY